MFYDPVPFEGTKHVGARTNHAAPRFTILLVEDNDDLRQVMEWILESVGYLVVSCGDAQFASETFRSRLDFDLLLTDFQMPGRSGVELARELTALRPSLAVMIVSGSIISDDLMREMRNRHWNFLSKPFDMPALLNTVQLMLRQGQQQAA